VLGCSYAETASICGVPVGTIRSRVARARADLDEIVMRDRAADRIMDALPGYYRGAGNFSPAMRH
jgi:hypothetical protein